MTPIRLLPFISTLAVAFFFAGCRQSESAENNEATADSTAVADSLTPPVRNVFIVEPMPTGTQQSIELPAIVEEGHTLSVGFKTAGQIEKIFVKEGDYIKEGAPVAVLDMKDYSLGVDMLRERYESMKTEVGRQTKLHASGNMTDNDFEKAVSGLHQLELQLKLEENRLAYGKLSSPASGIVTKVNFENSEMVDAGTPVIELMDNNALEAIVDLPVRFYPEHDRFVSYIGTSTALPGKSIPLKFLSLTPRADNAQLYRLRLAVPSGSGLTSGMSLMVKIVLSGGGGGGYSVPVGALFERDGKEYVWKVNMEDSTISAVEVATSGLPEDGRVLVTQGLNGTEAIVRAGVKHLSAGEKVGIINEESETNPGNVL